MFVACPRHDHDVADRSGGLRLLEGHHGGQRPGAAFGAERREPASNGDPDPRPAGTPGGLDDLGHAGADLAERGVAEPEPPGGAAQPPQVPGDRERLTAGDLDRFEHPVADGQAMVEDRNPRVARVVELTVHPYLHEIAP